MIENHVTIAVTTDSTPVIMPTSVATTITEARVTTTVTDARVTTTINEARSSTIIMILATNTDNKGEFYFLNIIFIRCVYA